MISLAKISKDALKDAILDLGVTIKQRIDEEGENEDIVYNCISRVHRNKRITSKNLKRLAKILKVNWRTLMEK